MVLGDHNKKGSNATNNPIEGVCTAQNKGEGISRTLHYDVVQTQGRDVAGIERERDGDQSDCLGVQSASSQGRNLDAHWPLPLSASPVVVLTQDPGQHETPRQPRGDTSHELVSRGLQGDEHAALQLL